MKYYLIFIFIIVFTAVNAQQVIELKRVKNNKTVQIIPGDPFTFSYLDSAQNLKGLHAVLVAVNQQTFTFRIGRLEEVKPNFITMPISSIKSIRKEGKYLYTQNLTMLFVTMLEVVPTVQFLVNNTANTTQAVLWALPIGAALGIINGMVESAFWPLKPRRKIGEYYEIKVVENLQ